MRQSAQVLLMVTMALSCSPRGQEVESKCVAGLDLDNVVKEALPEGDSQAGWEVSGSWKIERAPAAIAELLSEVPEYPSHVVMEFLFPGQISNLERFRSNLCEALELELKRTCESTTRNNRLLACTFMTHSAGRTGFVEVLPDTPDRSERTLIIVANEW